MTEKRYFYKINNNGALIIIDKTENILIRDMYRACDLLNAQHEENIELVTKCNKLEKENEQLKQTLQIKDYALQQQLRITENQQKRIRELEELPIDYNNIKETVTDSLGRIVGIYYEE